MGNGFFKFGVSKHILSEGIRANSVSYLSFYLEYVQVLQAPHRPGSGDREGLSVENEGLGLF